MENTIKIEGEAVLRISPIGTTEHKYDEASKMAGQAYRRFKFNGKAFSVNTSEKQFIEAQEQGSLHEVNLEVNEAGQLGFIDCVTVGQRENFLSGQRNSAKLQSELNYYKTAKFVPSTINKLEELPA